MKDITEYPLIAITEVFDLPSVDNAIDYGPVELGPTEDILDRKLNDVITCTYSYGWDADTVIQKPIHIVNYTGTNSEAYGHKLPESYIGCKLMGNGHHRLAFQAYVQGALFVHYTNDSEARSY